MKRKFINPSLLCMGLIICMTVLADLTGQWKGTVAMPDGSDIQLTYNLKAEGEKLTGTVVSPQGELPISDGKISGSNFTFNISIQGAAIPHAGKYYGDSVGIDIDYNGYKMHSTLKRAVAK
jgi:hypothetical protein